MQIKSNLSYHFILILPVKYKETSKKSLSTRIMMKQGHMYTLYEVVNWENVFETKCL